MLWTHCLPALIITIACSQPIHCKGHLKPPVLAGFDPAPRGSYRELICYALQPTSVYSIDMIMRYEWFKDGENWEQKGPFSTEQKFVFDPVTFMHEFYQGINNTEVSGKYMCRITNPEGVSAESEWRDLFVYHPCMDHNGSHPYELSVSPPNPTIGSTIVISCHIHHPNGTRVTWSKGSSYSQSRLVACTPPTTRLRYNCMKTTNSTYILQIKSAQKSDFVYWKCSEEGQCSSDPLKLNIPSPGKPVIVDGLSSRGITAVGERVTLQCKSTPPGDQYEWYKDGNVLPGTTVNLSLTVVLKNAGNCIGSYMCVARNSEGWKQSNIYSFRPTTVYFPNTKINFTDQPATVEVGHAVTITCETDESNPIASIKWLMFLGDSWRDVTTGITSYERDGDNGGKIAISKLSVTATKSLTYVKCRSFYWYSETRHTRVTGYADTRINVKWSATEIKVVVAPNSPIKENASFNIKCETDSSNSGGPEEISWYGNGQLITTDVTPSSRSATDGGTIYISQLRFTATKDDNQAKYECRINDRPSLKKDVTITVHFKPKWDPDLPPGLTAASKPGDEAKFVLNVIANPPPTVTWYLPDNKTATDKGFRPNKVNETTFTLSKRAIGVDDYRNYTASVENVIGKTLFVFELQRPGPPQSPCCLRLGNATAVSLTLSFKSNFSGGTPQTFSVEKRTSKGPWKVVIDGIEDPGFGNEVTEKSKELSSSTRFEFRVLATNEDGNTSSNTVEASTKAKPNVMFTVQRASNKVTITWQKLNESYSKIRIKYTPVNGGSHTYHTVNDPGDLRTSFSIDGDTTYYYSLEVFDGADLVYASPLRLAKNRQINTIVLGAGIGGVFFLLNIATVAVAVVFYFKKKRLAEIGGASKADVGMTAMEELPAAHEYAVVDETTRSNERKNADSPEDVYAEICEPQNPPKPSKSENQAVYSSTMFEENDYLDMIEQEEEPYDDVELRL